jgi:hypothetical protein
MRLSVSFCCVMVAALVGCKMPGTHNLPPAERLMHPGPGVDGPGPGVLIPEIDYGAPSPLAGATSQIAFVGPDGMMVNWDVSEAGMFDSEPLVVPGRKNFGQGGLYRLKLTNVPGRAGIELYPTLEVGPTVQRTAAYLAHNAIPVQFTEEDFDQVIGGNFVTKVIYLPNAEYQEIALAGVETLVSTRLDPGQDAIIEASKRGAILAIVRLGNKDLEVPGEEGEVYGGMGGGIAPVGYMGGGCADGSCGADGMGGMGGPPTLPGHIAGVNTPQWGMPMSGTPIGLPGPPHIPFGGPAGLKKHVMVNHTKHHLPGPVDKLRIDVKQRPGFSYPKPPSHAHITESNWLPPMNFRQPLFDKFKKVH